MDLSNSSNAEPEVSFDFLVKVTGDKLELHHDLLQSLLVPYKDNEIPVAIVTVIGQPKSRKTLLTNYIQNCIIRLVDKDNKQFGTAVTPTSGFPRSLNDCRSKSVRDKLDGTQGILIWTKPRLVKQEDGQSLLVFILDIWSENPSPSLYTRLVDFCITSSSVVIFVEDCCVSKESNWNQWDISKSFLAHLKGREFQNLHVLIRANWEEEHFHTLGLEGGNVFKNATKDQFSERLHRVIDAGHILREYFKDASYFLAPWKSDSSVQKEKMHNLDNDHIRGLLDFSGKVVGYDPSKIFPLARNKTKLSTLSVDSHFQNGIEISNKVAVVTEATDATTSQPNNMEVEEMEVCEDTQGIAEIPTPNQIESKKSSTDTQINFEGREVEMEDQSVPVYVTWMKSNVKVTNGFEESTNSNSQLELDKREANQLNADESEISDDCVIVDKPKEPISVSPHSSVLDGTGEAMDQTEAPEKPLEISKVPVVELKHGGHLVEAYRKKLNTFIDNSSATDLFFKDEDLESLHLQWKSQIWEDFSSQFPSSQDEKFHDTMVNEFDKIFTGFKQENSENRKLYYLNLSEGTNNVKMKFDQIFEKLRIQILQNPLEIVYDLRNDDLDGYYMGFTEKLPGKLKHYFMPWYSCKSDEFKEDFEVMKTMIKLYQDELLRVLISSSSKTKKQSKEAHVLHSENAEKMASSRKWNHEPLNEIAKEAILLMKETFAVCIDLTCRILGVYKKGFKAFFDNHSNSDTLYFEDDQLKSIHSKLKAKIEQYDVISKIPPSLVEDLLAKMKTECDNIFSDVLTEYSAERTSFYNYHEQVEFDTKRKFDEEVAKLELQIKKDPSNLLYDLKNANLIYYVKTLTQNVSHSKWKKYFSSWYSHELNEFREDVRAMISGIQFYRDQWNTFFNENVCVNENKFHEAHSIFAKFAEGDNNHTWKNNNLKILSRTGIELTKQSFNQLNLDLINKEEEMAKQASIFAEEHYNHLMKSQISERTFPDSEVKTLHEMYMKAVTDSFDGVPQFKYTYVWQRHLNELRDRLHNQLPSYLKENQQNVDRVQRTKKNLMSECTNAYNDSMNKLIAGRTISDKILRSHHDRSAEKVLQILNVRMNSITEKFDKSSWAKELAEKLRMSFNAFAEENNRKIENEAKNRQPAAAASIDYANARSTQPCGVGIYFGPDIVRLGTYTNPQTDPQYLEFSPFVTFEGDEIVFFNQHSSHHDHFDIYKTLVEGENFPTTVSISGKHYQLCGEEIVAVFLNKIKAEAEAKFRFVLTSCTVAVSAFMSTSSKQILKTALTLAGFERSTIIQSTTAVGLSSAVINKVKGNVPAIFIHQCGSVFDVAIAVINQTSVCIRNINGLPYLEKPSGYLSKFLGTTDSQDNPSKKVKKIIRSILSSTEFYAWELKTLVMAQGKEYFINDISAITEPLYYCHSTTLDEAQGIVFGAAAFNAFQKKIPGAPKLEYKEVFPYTVIADINGKQIAKIVGRNISVTSKNMSTRVAVTDVWDSKKVSITEFAVEKEKNIVGEYTINPMNSKCRNFFLFVKFNYEGLIEVEAQTADFKAFPVQIRTKALTMAQQCAAVENLGQILTPTVAPFLPNVPVKNEVKTNSYAVENEMPPPVVAAQNSKTKLADLIADVKDRLAKGTATNPMIVTRINERIKECEELLGKDDVKEKQIEIQIKLLDLAAAKIK